MASATTKTQTTTTTVSVDSTVAELPVSAETLIKEFNDAKAAIKALTAEKAAAEKAIRELLGDAEVGTIGGVERVKISFRNTSKIDRETLKSAWPEAYEATLVESPYTVLTTK
jgi:predicted phage-related endonuclease